jgi:hypothetical protein
MTDDEIQTMLAEVERLRAALVEAADDLEMWGAYAGEYFREKWDLAGDVARIRLAAVAPKEPTS